MAIDSDLFLADLHVTAGLVAWRTRNEGGNSRDVEHGGKQLREIRDRG